MPARREPSIGRWRRGSLIGLLGAVIGTTGLVGAILIVGLLLSAPARAPIGAPPAHVMAVAFPAADKTVLRGWFLQGQPGHGAVLLMHGVRANRRSMTRRAELLWELGFSVLWFDFRAHGESDGHRITFGANEALDAAAAVTFLRARLPGERIGAIGASLGGAAALLGPGPLRIDALVLEAVYPDIERALDARFRVVLGGMAPIVAPLLTPLFVRLAPLVTGAGAAELRPIDRIGAFHGPLMIASGTADTRTPPVDTAALFGAAAPPKSLWFVPGAGHEDLHAFDPREYRARVITFLLQALR